MSIITTDVIRTIITDENSAELMVKEADALAKSLKSKELGTSQIRAIFGEVRQIQAQWRMGNDEQRSLARRRLILLKPKMAYRAERERKGRDKNAVEDLVNVLTPALDFVIEGDSVEVQNKRFTNFVEFFEAILAYHKAHGGK